MQPVISKGLNELVLIVKDVSLSRRFYSEVVGLSLDSDASPGDDEWTWFTTGEPGHARRIALHKGELMFEEFSALPAGHRFGAVHFAIGVDQTEWDLGMERLRLTNTPFYGPVRQSWMHATSVYFFDPDQNLVEWILPD